MIARAITNDEYLSFQQKLPPHSSSDSIIICSFVLSHISYDSSINPHYFLFFILPKFYRDLLGICMQGRFGGQRNVGERIGLLSWRIKKEEYNHDFAITPQILIEISLICHKTTLTLLWLSPRSVHPQNNKIGQEYE